MLTDAVEIEIIAKAEQVNVRNPKRSRKHFENIFEDFLTKEDFHGKSYLDLGPGQFDFGMMVQERGGKCVAIDKDPAVIELGRYKGFEVFEGRLENIEPQVFGQQFDGVFCKYSINALWYPEEEEHLHQIEMLFRLIKPGGWAWIAPWNGAFDTLNSKEVKQILSTQIQGFTRHGFWAIDLTDELSRRYGVHGATANRALFVYNLPKPDMIQPAQQLSQNGWFTRFKQIFNSWQ